jgi:hypothetical protein
VGVGLFGAVGAAGEVRNVGLDGGSVVGYQSVGGIAGHNYGAIRNTVVTADVGAADQTAGANVGGIAGWNDSAGTITDARVSGDVTGGDNTGGIAGQNNGKIARASMTGEVSGRYSVGGLVGRHEMSGASIVDSYAAGEVRGKGEVGGAVGRHIGSLNRAYAVGSVIPVDGAIHVGGLIGRHMGGAVTDSYFDAETTGQGGSGEPRTTTELRQRATYVDAWDFAATWSIDEGAAYPALRPSLAAPTGVAAAAADGDAIVFGWNAVALAHRYQVYVSTTSGSYGGTPTAIVTASSYTVADAVYGTAYYVTVRAVNSMATSEASVEAAGATEDVTPPTLAVATKKASGDYAEGTWTNGSVTVNVYANDADSGIADVTYRIGGGADLPYPGEPGIVLEDEGTHAVSVRATDRVGLSTSDSVEVRIDKTPPTASFGTNGNEAWATAASTTVTVSDAASGTDGAGLRYVWTTGTEKPASGWAPFESGETLRKSGGEGDWYLHVEVMDLAGNRAYARSDRFRLRQPSPAAAAPDAPSPQNRFYIGGNGGTVEYDGVRIRIPSGAHAGSFDVTIEAADDVERLPLAENERFASRVMELTKSVSGPFEKNVTIELDLSEEGLRALREESADRTDITLRWFDEVRGEWVELDDNAVENGVARGTTNHFTKFAAIARTVEAPDPESEDEVRFTDLVGHWAADSIHRYASEAGLTGYPDGTFGPDRAVTRAEFVTMLATAYAWPDDVAASFNDTAGHWAERSIAAAVGAGIVQGYDAKTFAPDSPIAREEMAAMAAKALRLLGGESEETPTAFDFVDRDDVAAWARAAVAAAADRGVLAGYADGTFRPKAYATRAEAVVVLLRMRSE